MRNQCIYYASIIMFSYRISYQILCFNMYWLLSVSYVLLNDFSQWARNIKYLLCDVIIENKFIICFSYSNFLFTNIPNLKKIIKLYSSVQITVFWTSVFRESKIFWELLVIFFSISFASLRNKKTISYDKIEKCISF